MGKVTISYPYIQFEAMHAFAPQWLIAMRKVEDTIFNSGLGM